MKQVNQLRESFFYSGRGIASCNQFSNPRNGPEHPLTPVYPFQQRRRRKRHDRQNSSVNSGTEGDRPVGRILLLISFITVRHEATDPSATMQFPRPPLTRVDHLRRRGVLVPRPPKRFEVSTTRHVLSPRQLFCVYSLAATVVRCREQFEVSPQRSGAPRRSVGELQDEGFRLSEVSGSIVF